jgi:hypothetical protein
MRNVFISYARQNKADVVQLVEHLNVLGCDTWMDSSLRGGQDWWEEILRRIADCEVFLAIVSGAVLNSVACAREFEWAEALGKPVLPVSVESPSMALPARFMRRQIIDYSNPAERDRAALTLAGGLATLPPAPPLPEPLPEPPAAPLSYLTDLIDRVISPEPLGHDQQRHIIVELEPALRSLDPEERRGGLDILERFSIREDLYADVDKSVDRLRRLNDEAARLSTAPTSGTGSANAQDQSAHTEQLVPGSAATTTESAPDEVAAPAEVAPEKGAVGTSDAPANVESRAGATDSDLAAVMGRAGQALVWGGLKEVADRATSLLRAPPPSPTLVVVGEVKRGKSSLVNALLGHPGASPVDVEITTSAYIRFVPATDSDAEGNTTLVYAGGRREPIDNADMTDWVTVRGRRVTDPNAKELPLGAEVVVRGMSLPRLTIVDTPGVGGLNPNHLRLSTTAAAQATMLLMTCDAMAPITGPELEFLSAVTGEVDTVVIAVTKIDKNLRHWRSIVEENRRLLRQHAPRFADVPMFGVSSLNAVAALKMEPGERRDAALQASGLPQLVACLDGISSSSDNINVANSLRVARTGLERVARNLAVQRSAMAGTTTPAELSAEKERLNTLRQEWESGWRDYLARDLNGVQRTTLGSLDHKLEGLRTTWRKRLEAAKLDVLRRAPQLFVADMTADLQVLIQELSNEYVEAIVKVVNDLKLDTEVAVGGLSMPDVRPDDAPQRGKGVFDPTMVTMGVMGASYSRLLVKPALVPVLGVLGISVGSAAVVPFVLAVGGAWVAVNFGFRALKMGRQNLLQWLNTTITTVNKDAAREIQEKTDNVRPVIVNEYRRQLTDSMAQLQKVIATAETAAKASRAEQGQSLKELDTRRKALGQLAAMIDAQLARFAPRTAPVHP